MPASTAPAHRRFPLGKSTLHDAGITPVAAVARASTDPTGPLVIAALHPKIGFHFAEAAASAPPPTLVVNTPGALGIPTMALAAYRNAEKMMATSEPGCGISWNLLAGIGRIESGHANDGATDARGTAVRPIYGPTLDGTLPGNEVIVQSSAAGRVSYARAMGPMQFLPGTWVHYASDGDGDGTADPQNLYDATLAAARYLCSGNLNLRDQSQVLSSILRYNNSMPYAQNVLGWAAAYATGVVPVDLPPLTGPPPPLGDAHLENAEGLGPNLPLNMHGLSANDPLARMPLIDLSGNAGNGQPWSAQGPATYGPSCTVICIGEQTPGPVGPTANTPPSGAAAPAAPPPFAPPAAPHRSRPRPRRLQRPLHRRRLLRLPSRLRRLPSRLLRPPCRLRRLPRPDRPFRHVSPPALDSRSGSSAARPGPHRRRTRLEADVRSDCTHPRRAGQGDRSRTAPSHHRTRDGQRYRARPRR